MASVIPNKISEMKNEVNDLHPLLSRLFNRLPNIKEVSYCHGTSEIGADYVLTQYNNTLQTFEYIGVIAKVGSIKQDYSSIEKQIRECRVQRVVSVGKRRVKLNQIWVVVTGNISNNAQEKIYDEFEIQNVQFIDHSRLTTLVTSHLPEYWSESNLEVNEYLSTLKAKNEEIDRKMSLVRLDDKAFYIEQDIVKQVPKHYGPKATKAAKSTKVNIQDEILKHDFIMIEGGMGAGKSKLLRKLVGTYTDTNYYAENKIIPVPMSFKELIDVYDANVEKAIELIVKDKIGKTAQQEATYVLLIDAVDEKNLPIEQQLEYLQIIRSEIEAGIKLKVVITSRELHGIDANHEVLKDIVSYEIVPLTTRKIIDFLQTLCAQFNLSGRLIEDLQNSQLFRELPKSPIAAILLAQLLNENSEDLPSNLTELYTKYMELVLGRWDIDKGLQSQKEYEALDNILMSVSRFILDNELSCISIEDAKVIFQGYLEERNLGIEIESLFEKLHQRCEIVSINENTNTLTFKHRTFVEFLYAKSLAKENNLIVDSRIFQPYWIHTYFFSIGLKKDAPELIESIVNYVPDDEMERWIKLCYMADYFLAAYLTPYDVIKKGVTKIMIEAAHLYEDTVNGSSRTPFTIFPRMQILYFMRCAISQNYSYDFLKKAVEHGFVVRILFLTRSRPFLAFEPYSRA